MPQIRPRVVDFGAEPVRALRGGRYAIVGVLGVGSQAETLHAVDASDGRAVAIKRFHVRGAKSWKDVELAEREARVLSTLSHPNLPVYIEHFEEAGALYLVMEKIEGETLASLRRRRGALSVADVTRFLADADGVLRYLHARSPMIIHRDIKPGNVIRRADGSYAFVDFGSVRDQLKPEGGSTVVGTFGYMAPEQFQGRALPGSDVYAVAATALALLTGREPEDLPHRGLAIDVPAALSGAVEPWLVRGLTAMLEPDPDKRPREISARAPAQRGRARAEWDPEREERPAERSRVPDVGREWQRPLVSEWFELREQSRAKRRAVREEAHRLKGAMEQQFRQEMRNAKRRARGLTRSRRARHAQWHTGGPASPVLLFAVAVALTAARVANWALFRVFLPTLLGMLSWFLGPGLQRAARRCRAVGAAGGQGLERALDAVLERVRGRNGKRDDANYGNAEPPKPTSADEPRSEPIHVRSSSLRARVESASYEEEVEDPSHSVDERRRQER